jgi:predicted Zn-dependent protease
VAYGVALFGRGRLGEAETQLRAAVDLSPADPVARGRLGAVLAAQGRLEDAVVELRRAAAVSGGRDVQVLMVLASALAQAGHLAEASATAREAAGVAQAQGRTALADELARRAAAFEAMARR